MREVEAAKRELVEYQQLTEQKLQEEREKTSRAVVSLFVRAYHIHTTASHIY